ncbi:flagellar basal body P-ring formation chaperone FlgA [Roseimaritima ulvae]|uniref:Flagellar basal body P-ring biosynthesis protein FlgA n=1 Tax=Roseimaritima ulvae TaxID=980254 RepID=A0A5B9QWL5_9BACT|nr:flagellar basal body P-ring formation chaperone FlgA [Roseimaritima ulvae]QEG42180.1 flagellar basal body P-ring biosynthesis protein FlgA [Roseimaritima ulvae]
MLLRLLIIALTCAGLRTALAQPAAPPMWTLQALGQVTVETSVVRLRDVVKPNAVPPAQWERLGRLVVALVPPDGRRLSLQRQRIAEAFARRIAAPAAVRWAGPEIIFIDYRPPAAANHRVAAAGNQVAGPRQTRKVATAAATPTAFVTNTPHAAESAEAAQAEPLPRVVVARRSLRRGDIVSPSDFQLEPLAEGRSSEGLVLDVDAIVGQEVKTSLLKGRPVRRDDLGPPTVIRRGDLLELSVLGGGIVVRTNAKASEEGSVGQLIQVETQQPRRRLLARVVAPGAVEILTRPPQVSAE